MPKHQPINRQLLIFMGVTALCGSFYVCGPAWGQAQKFIMMAPSAAPANLAVPGATRQGHSRAPVRKNLPKPFEDVVLLSDQIFEQAKDQLTDSGIAKLTGMLASLRHSVGSNRLEIVVRIDNFGFEKYNQDLTQRRAERIKSFFVMHGVAREKAVLATGEGSRPAGGGLALQYSMDPKVRNRIVEISIDRDIQVESDPPPVAAKPAPEPTAPKQTEESAVGLPPELQQDLVDSSMVGGTTAEGQAQPEAPAAPEHIVNTGEWGDGGTNFGNNIKAFGENVQYNEDGKKVVKLKSATELMEKQRKETIEAQNEFGLWRDR